MASVRKIWEFLFGNFMWLYIIMGLLRWVGIYPMTFQLLMLVSVIYCFFLVKRIRKNNSLDLFVLLYLLYILVNSIVIDYPHHFSLWYKDAMFSLLPISCYYIARTTEYDLEKMLSKMTIPITVAMFLGVVFYFYNPSWYSAEKYAQLLDNYGYAGGNIPEQALLEAFRLSSIWVTPYVIGYANAIFITFLTVQLSFMPLNKKERRKYVSLFLLSFVVLILAGFKAVLLYFMLFFLYSLFLSNQSKQKLKFVILGLFILICVDIVFTSNSEYANFFVERFVNSVSEEGLSSRLEYTGKSIDLWTFWGNGFGRYCPAAKLMNGSALQDSQYQKTLAELGIFGFFIFVLMLLTAIVHSFGKRKLILEFGIILFYTISFIGSSSISAETTFSFVFWYVLGRISKKTKKVRLIK